MSNLTPDMPQFVYPSRFPRPPRVPASAHREARAHAAAAAAAGLARRFQTIGKESNSRKLKDGVAIVLEPVAAPTPAPTPVPTSESEVVVTSVIEPITTFEVAPIIADYPKGLKKALFIGIEYKSMPSIELKGCANDVALSQQKIQELYPECEDVRVITDATEVKPTRKNILEAIRWLVSDVKPGQHIFFHYSGHGGQLVDKNGAQKSVFENCIYPYKGRKLQIILDEEIRKELVEKIPQGSKCFIVLDSRSGNATIELEHSWQTTEDHTLYYMQNIDMPHIESKVIVLSTCQPDDADVAHGPIYEQTSGALSSILPLIFGEESGQLEMKEYMWSILRTLQKGGYSKAPYLSASRPMGPTQIIDLSM
jgi:hypothetical protein